MAEPLFMPDVPQKPVYVCGEYRIDVLRRRIYAKGEPLAVTAKAFDVLVELVARAGEVVTKDELIDAVWADTIVEENNLTQQVSALRKLFNERARDHRFIVTVPGRGYCFVARVHQQHLQARHPVLLAGSTTSSITIDISNSDRERPVGSFSFDAAALRGSAIAVVYVVFVCFAAFLFNGQNTAEVRPQSVGVLAFRTLGFEDDRYGAGIRDTLQAKLGSLEDITLRPVGDALLETDTLAIGRRMNIDVVLAGSVQRDRDRIRVSVEIVDVRGQCIIWGKTFDDKISNLFELQDSIAAEVARALLGPRRSEGSNRSEKQTQLFTRFKTADAPRSSVLV
jgi:DNA-binding winged helix-turn-helix (wHTH) protein/TolB-like protein